jgi:SAM-dependent methyltransferase
MIISARSRILTDIESYYSLRLREHGPCARGADWNGEESQQVRFEQLLKIIPGERTRSCQPVSLNDFGCGYGALAEYVIKSGMSLDYHGFDLSSEMIAAAIKKNPLAGTTFEVNDHCRRLADYSVASGLFNVKQTAQCSDWQEFLIDTLNNMNECSRHGFSFNCLTSYADADRMREHLHYADPSFYFDYCKKQFSKDVALLHDYGLYEFTILVRKRPVVPPYACKSKASSNFILKANGHDENRP